MVNDAVDVYDIPDGVGNVIGVLHPGRRVSLVEPCRDGWCRLSADKTSGWAQEAEVWGVADARQCR